MNGGGLVTKAAAALPQAAGQGAGVPLEQLLMPLINLGAVGYVCWWLMTRTENRLNDQTAAIDRLRHALNRLTMTGLLEVTTRREVPAAVKRQAEALIDEIKTEENQDAAAKNRGGAA